jgi:hypothetical protein
VWEESHHDNTGWGSESWTKTVIEAYVWPEKYWLVWAGPLANHPFNFNFIFLSDGATAAAERATCFADLYNRYPVLFRSDERT